MDCGLDYCKKCQIDPILDGSVLMGYKVKINSKGNNKCQEC